MMHSSDSHSSLAAGSEQSARRRPVAAARQTQGRKWLGVATAAAFAASCLGAVTAATAAESWTPPDTFTATTTGMDPADVRLKIDVKEWPDADARAAVVTAIAGNDAPALSDLPTIGYVWVSGSGVGYALKYAEKSSTPEGERVTFVTDRPVGSYDFKPWTAGAAATGKVLTYSVIELDLDASGNGTGTLSLAADVAVDTDSHTLSLDPGAPRLLAEAKAEPKPYWARHD